MIILIFFFFFSSRRRHTRLQGDWSSDVCSSDLEDPTTWTRPWTVKQEFNLQDNKANRIYTEPRCHEGNFGMTALLAGARAAEKAFAEGRGPDPATFCIGGCGVDPEGVLDPLALR